MLFGKPWERGAAVVGFDLLGLLPSGKFIVSLIPLELTVVSMGGPHII